jgi:nucleoside-diphosphate-sugar epimerase
VDRLAVLTGSPGAVLDAVSAALAQAGFAVRHLALPTEAPARTEDARGAEIAVHVGIRTPRELDEPLRARAEHDAALAAGLLARDAGARRYVHVSTAAVYGRPRNLPCREGELKKPRTAQERIRWRAEQGSWAAFRKGAPLVVLRPTPLYGPTLRGGPVRALALVALFNQRKRRVPILRRGPVAHLLHLDDLARAVVHVALHPDDRDVTGRAFNVGDEAPLPLAEHVAAALQALGYQPGRILPSLPRLYAFLLWVFRHVPDRVLLDPVNRRLLRGWRVIASRIDGPGLLSPRVEREALHWMSCDHYYDTSRLRAIGWRALHPVSTVALPDVVRALVAGRHLPDPGAPALPAW